MPALGQVLGINEISALKHKAFKVIKENKGMVVLQASNMNKGQKILFVRAIPELDEFEVISQGVVKVSNDKLTLVELNSGKLAKYPQAGDFAVTMGEPKKFEVPTLKQGMEGFTVEAENPEEPERGYVDIGFLRNQGTLNSSTSNRANSYKNINKYTNQGLSFVWHPEFLPNYGIEYTSADGGVIVYDYYGTPQESSTKTTKFRLSYRNRISPSKLRWKLFLQSTSSQFQTLNADEYVLQSTQNGLGLGGLIGYEFHTTLPFSATAGYGAPAGIYLEAYYVPNLSVVDSAAVQRGTSSSGSNSIFFSVAYSHLFYIEQIPWFKRYFLELKYAVSKSNINFQGPTKNAPANFYIIPENGTYSENETVLSLNIGLRFEDWMGKSLKPRSK